MADVGVFSRYKGFNDFQEQAKKDSLAAALANAQIQTAQAAMMKAQQVDADKLGEQAFLKRAQGIPTTPEEDASLLYIDSKTGGVIQDVYGNIIKRPSLLEKANMKGSPAPSVNMPAPNMAIDVPTTQPTMTPDQATQVVDLFGAEETPSLPTVPNLGNRISPKTGQAQQEADLKSGRTRVDELIATAGSAGAAKQAASTMGALQPNIGYTGVGGGLVGFGDKVLTGAGFPDVIAGTPQAREAFQTQGVDAWVKAVEPLKGALTEREGARFDMAVSSLDTSPEGIKLRAKITEAMAERAAIKAQFYESYLAQNGTLTGADAVWNNYSDQNPVITDELLGGAKPTLYEKGEAEFNSNKISKTDAINELRRRGKL